MGRFISLSVSLISGLSRSFLDTWQPYPARLNDGRVRSPHQI